METYKRLLLFERDPDGSLRKPQLCTPPFARGFLGECDLITTDDPLRGEYLAGILHRLTEQIGDTHLIVRSYGAMGAPLRGQGRLEAADEVYSTGLALAAKCPCTDPSYKLHDGDVRCMPDLTRRRAHLRIDQSYEGTVPWTATEAVAREAVSLATTDETRGRALVALGLVRMYRSDLNAALADFDTALELLPLNGRWKWLQALRWAHYTAARQNVTLALSRSNDPDDVRRGVKLFPKVRRAWRKLRDKKTARAVLDWNEATLTLKAIQLGVIPGAEAAWAQADVIDVLEDARKRLLSPVDIFAISADLAAALRPDAKRMRAALESLKTTPHLELPQDLASHLEEVLAARSQADLTAALQSFRDCATGMGALPSLFSY